MTSIQYPAQNPNAPEVFYRVIAKNGNGPPVFIDDLLSTLKVPLLLLWGAKDPWIRPQVSNTASLHSLSFLLYYYPSIFSTITSSPFYFNRCEYSYFYLFLPHSSSLLLQSARRQTSSRDFIQQQRGLMSMQVSTPSHTHSLLYYHLS